MARRPSTTLTPAFVKSVAGKPRDNVLEVRDGGSAGVLILRVEKSGATTYYASWGRGQRRAIPNGHPPGMTIEAARKAAHKMVSEPFTAAAVEREAKGKDITLAEFIGQHYLPWAAENMRVGKALGHRLNDHFLGKLGRMKLGEISTFAVEGWRMAHRKRGIAPSTLNTMTQTLQGIRARAIDWGFLPPNPAWGRIKPLKAVSERIRYLSPEEEERLALAVAARDAQVRQDREGHAAADHRRIRPAREGLFADFFEPLLIVMLQTGLRPGETKRLRWQDIDFDREQLTVRPESAKSGKARYLPMSELLIGTLRAWRLQSAGEWVFPGARGNAPIADLKRPWGDVRRRAGLQDYVLHANRHSFASALVQRGASLYAVGALLGHADTRVTSKYSHLSPESQRAVLDLLTQPAPRSAAG